MTDPALAPRLREALTTAGYDYDSVAALLGRTAHAALQRNETVPGLRATAGGSALETLVRLWLLQTPVPLTAAETALPGLVDPLCATGLLTRSVGEVRARLDCRPYGTDADAPMWVVSDLTPGLDGADARVAADHVLGLSSASSSLAQLTVREPVGAALDLGTGCGVQSLHLAAHAGQVVATDVNERALDLTRFNAALNDVEVETRAGNLFEPVHGDAFDLLVTNPPFVISPATGERLVYRDSGLPGDQVVERIVRAVPRHLRPGGHAQILANWAIETGRPWDERLTTWLDGVDAWVVQREVADLPSYVELWLKDAGQHPSTGEVGLADYLRRYDTWLSWLESQGVEAVGFGWINLRRTDAAPRLRLEEWPWEVAQPLGAEVAAHFVRRLPDDAGLRGTRLVRRIDVRQETQGEPGAEDPESIMLRQQAGMRRARQVDTAEAALVGACDGDLTVGQILDALERLLEAPQTGLLQRVRELVAEGFLEVAD